MCRTCRTHEGDEKYINIYVIKSHKGRQFERPRSRREDNIKMDF
jgi:hypothetical protein